MSHAAHDLGEVFPEDRALVHRLKGADAHFARLTEEYGRLDRAIHRAEQDIEPTDDAHMTCMRRERMRLLDHIARRLRVAANDRASADAH